MASTTSEVLTTTGLPIGPAAPLRLPDDGGIDVAYWLDLGRRYRWLVGASALAAALVTLLAVVRQPSVYTARATLQLEPRYPHILDMTAVRAEEVHDELRYIRTQYEVLRSRSLAERVIRDEALRHEPAVGGVPADAATDWSSLDPGLVDSYLDGLWVEPVAGTRLIQVSFTSTEPALAARIANAHAEAYVDLGHRERATTNEAGLQFLRARLVELRERLERSEGMLNAYRWEKGIIALDDRENVVVEQLDSLIKQLSKAEGQRIALEADVHAIETHGADVVPDVVKHGGIDELSVHLALAESEYARAAARFKPAYPRVMELGRQVEALRSRVASETRRVVESIETAYHSAVEKEAQMRARLEEQKTRALQLKDESIQYAILAREVETNRELYDSVLQRMKQIAVASELRSTNVSVVDRAAPPTEASGPARLRSIGFAALVGVLLALGLIVVRETLDDSVKSVEQTERHARVPALGVVPEMTVIGAAPPAQGPWALLDRLAPASRAMPVRSVVARRPAAVVMDAYRTIRTSLLLSRPGGPPRSMLVASGLDGEGKTTTAVNLAAAFAQLGGSVVVVDADLRRPTCHQVLGLAGGPGLAEVLAGQAELTDVLETVAGLHLTLLPAGETPPNPTELLGSDEMRALLGRLAERFDYVFLDSPAVLAVPDATVLSTLVDGVVLVGRGRRTPRRVLAKVRDRLQYARAPLLGIVLNGGEEVGVLYASSPTIEVRPEPPRARARRDRRTG
jgi:capsular exopolysaccharide synthesis family protein